MTTDKPLSGKVAMVTGSSSGIGRAIALHLANNGASVIVHGRSDSDRLTSVAEEIGSLNVSAKALTFDFSNAKDGSWSSFVENAWDLFGSVDCWVNNAGGDVLTGDWPEKQLEAKLQFLWQTDVTSTLMLSRCAGERMKESAGTIVNIGWDQAWQGMAGDSGELFATTKGAVMSMTKSLAQSYAPNVRVNCVAPGWIKTKWGKQASDYWNERAESESLMNRWGTPEDVANAVSFLCSDASGFINGHVLPVNGGFRYG